MWYTMININKVYGLITSLSCYYYFYLPEVLLSGVRCLGFYPDYKRQERDVARKGIFFTTMNQTSPGRDWTGTRNQIPAEWLLPCPLEKKYSKHLHELKLDKKIWKSGNPNYLLVSSGKRWETEHREQSHYWGNICFENISTFYILYLISVAELRKD